MSRYLRPEQLEHLMWKVGEVLPPKVPPPPSGITGGIYVLMPQIGIYAQGVHALREVCAGENNQNHPKYTLSSGGIYRPLTFKEDINARVEDYNKLKDPDGSDRSLDDRLTLFSRWNDSCTGIAYQRGTTKFKIIPICSELITIDQNFNTGAISIDYATMRGTTELDRASGKYNTSLTKLEIENHEAWRFAVEGDVALLKAYIEIVFAAYQQKYSTVLQKGMGFYLRDNPGNELRALFVGDLGDGSGALGNYDLGGSGSFVRVAPSRQNSP